MPFAIPGHTLTVRHVPGDDHKYVSSTDDGNNGVTGVNATTRTREEI